MYLSHSIMNVDKIVVYDPQAPKMLTSMNLNISIFIVSPCILMIHQLLKTNKCTIIYCVYSKTLIKTVKKLLHVSILR
jgi:hypothetical protein